MRPGPAVLFAWRGVMGVENVCQVPTVCPSDSPEVSTADVALKAETALIDTPGAQIWREAWEPGGRGVTLAEGFEEASCRGAAERCPHAKVCALVEK